MWVIDVSPIVACIGLAFMDQHCMKPVRNLEQHKGHSKCWLTNGAVTFCTANMTNYRNVLLTCIIDLSEYISSMVLWILVILPCRSGGKNITYNLLLGVNLMFTSAILQRQSQEDLPRVSFSTSLLQRCKQPSSTLNSSSVMWRGAGCMGRSGGSRDWVKGLWMGTLCCWAAVEAVVGPEAGPELSRGGKESCSVVLWETQLRKWK